MTNFFLRYVKLLPFRKFLSFPLLQKKKNFFLRLHKLQKYKPLHLERFLKIVTQKNKIQNDDDSKNSGYYLDILNEYQELF